MMTQDQAILKKKGAYSFLKQYSTSAVERILVHLSISCSIVSLKFDLSVNKEILTGMDQINKKILNWHEPNLY
jgi:hypothetical protein